MKPPTTHNWAALGKIVIVFLSFYYILTGLWGLFFSESFQTIVWRKTFPFHAIFEMHTLSALFIANGIYLFWERHQSNTQLLALLISAALFSIEIYYFNHIAQSLLIWDLFIEGISAILLFIAIVTHQSPNKAK